MTKSDKPRRRRIKAPLPTCVPLPVRLSQGAKAHYGPAQPTREPKR